MKTYDGRYAIWWMLGAVVLLTLIAITTAYAGFAYTQEGFEGGVSFQHSDGSSCDSARFFFGYDGAGVNSDNLYTSIKLTPINSDSSTLEGTGLDLDSTGMHIVEIYFWLAGSSDSTGLVASWLHLPAAEALLGNGPDSIVIYTNDTSGTDTPIGGVSFSIKYASGEEASAYRTDPATGKITVTIFSGSYTIFSQKDGYIFESFALTAAGNDDSVEVAGYNRIIGSSGIDSVCRVHGYISKGFDSVDARSVTVTATLPNDTYDSCANTIIFDRIKATRSNANGYWFLDLIFSSCLNGELYQFRFEKKGIEPFTKSLTVPDSVSHQVTWDD